MALHSFSALGFLQLTRRVRRWAPVFLCAWCAAAGAGELPAAVDDPADEIDLAEIVRRPAIGNYKGYAEFKMAHYAAARRIWEALDAKGFGEAAFSLGMLYEDGLGVDKDMPRALAYYRRGAGNGSQKAMFRLGLIYWLGLPNVPRDAVSGRHYLELAAAAGDEEAARYLTADAEDVLVAADKAMAEGKPGEAFERLTAAANAGNLRAQTRLGWAYEAGRGVERDLARAVAWFRRAAEGGDGEAMYALGVMHATGAGQSRDAALAAEWLQKSAAAGYAPAVAELKAH